MLLTTMERNQVNRQIAYLNSRFDRINKILSGQLLTGVYFVDASITAAKIHSLSASKITTEELSVDTDIYVGVVDDGDYIQFAGGDVRILMYSLDVPQLLIGMQSGTPVVKIGKDGINALTDTDPNNFVLYVDQTTDYILIKQKAEGTSSVNGTTNLAHGLGYVPFCLAFVEVSSGVWRKLFSQPYDGSGYWFEVNGTNLVLRNTTGSAKNFAYYIFYENIT